MPAETSSTRSGAGYLYGLDVLRVIASTFVVYTHVANWYSTRKHNWLVSDWVDTALITPLHLNPAASFLGVGTFLLISGAVVTRVADRETSTQFLWRRMSRIAPLLVACGAAAWFLTNLGVFRAASGPESPSLLDLLLGTTLAGFFTTPELVLLGVTWTLLVQIAFYMYVAGTIPLLRSRPWVPPALLAAFECFLLSLVSDETGVAAHRIGIVAAYLPVLCLGQLITLVRAGKVHPTAASTIGIAHVFLFVWADKLGVYFRTGDSHPRTLLLVFGVVVLAMNIRGPISRSRITRHWAARTYAIYLLHPLCIYPIMDWLSPHLGTSLSLVCAISVLAVVTELAHRFVEQPVERWLRGRRNTRKTVSARAR